jgi:putative flippase GtrA
MFMDLGKHRLALRRFTTVGVVNTSIDFGLFWLLTHFADFWIWTAHILSFSCAVLNSYVMNKYWTFGHREPPKAREFRNFLAVVMVGFMFSLSIIYVFETTLGLYLAKAVSIVLTMLWNYYGATKVFRLKSEQLP